MSLTNKSFHRLPLVPNEYKISLFGLISLSMSALKITLSTSESPTFILPPGPALRYALPSTRISPVMCTLESIKTSVLKTDVLEPLTVKPFILLSTVAPFKRVFPVTFNTPEISAFIMLNGVSFVNTTGVAIIVLLTPLKTIGANSELAVSDSNVVGTPTSNLFILDHGSGLEISNGLFFVLAESAELKTTSSSNIV